MRFTSVPIGIQTVLCESLSQANLPITCCIIFWEAERIRIKGQQPPSSEITFHIHHPGVLRDLFLQRDPLTVAEAYLKGFLDFSGDLESLIYLFRQVPRISLSRRLLVRAWLEALTLPALPSGDAPAAQQRQVAQSPEQDKAAIQHHYDVGNAFYQLWLDPQLVYTCAYYESPEMSLTEAQAAKLDLICRKLQLQPGETLLDTGCGWGALLRWAAKHYGVKGYGITLSEEQVAFNRKQIAEEGLTDQLQVELRDYRDLPQQPAFDKAVAIGIIEHVGQQNYPVYFNQILSVLKPGGLFLNHGITASHEGKGKTIGERFINRYFFPNGELVRISSILTATESAGWEIVDVDAWRPHYAMTLRHWAENFERAMDQVVGFIGGRQALFWQIYLIGCALAFENNALGLYQVLLRKQADHHWNLPLTRQGWLV